MSASLTRGGRIVVASHNPGKVWEINQLIAPFGLDAVSAGDLGLAEPEETEPTFHGNAKLKAVAAARGSGLIALADDSGLEVECLGGAPGIYSARWAGPEKDFGLAMRKVGEEITARHGWAAPGPRANFISVLCLADPSGATQEFEGKVFGHLVWPPRGGNGFGYDPMFVADGETQTFGEMQPAQKYAISHRTRAFAAFKAACLDPLGIAPSQGDASPAGSDVAAFRAAAASLSTKVEAANFIKRLSADYAQNASHWDAQSINTFLNAAAGALATPDAKPAPPWRDIANALLDAAFAKPKRNV